MGLLKHILIHAQQIKYKFSDAYNVFKMSEQYFLKLSPPLQLFCDKLEYLAEQISVGEGDLLILFFDSIL